MKTENGIIKDSEFVESIVAEMNDRFNEGYIDRMGDLESYRNRFPEAKRKISDAVANFINVMCKHGIYSRREAIAEAQSILHEVEADLSSGRFG